MCCTTNESVVIGVAALDHNCPVEYKDAGIDTTTQCIVPHWLAVHPSHRGKGVALSLLNKAIELAKASNYSYVELIQILSMIKCKICLQN